MGYVYLIKCYEFYKIGIAENVRVRLCQLQIGNPISLSVVTYYAFPAASVVEDALHKKFAEKRTVGEWFALTDDEIQLFHKMSMEWGGVVGEQIKPVQRVAPDQARSKPQSRPTLDKFCDGRTDAEIKVIGQSFFWAWWELKNGKPRRRTAYGGEITEKTGA